MIRIGLIGCGYWGPNLLRNFMETEGAWISHICDLDSNLLGRLRRRYPSLTATTDYKNITTSPEIDAVAIATPVGTHFGLAKEALEHGKHVLVEKPLAASSTDAEQLIELAERKNLCLMVDHTFVYSEPVRVLKENLSEIGELCYFDSTRVNLGLFQKDINVIWDLGPHDVSILLYLMAQDPEEVAATGIGHLNPEIENTAYLVLKFPNQFIAHFHFNWLSPIKIRQILISGTEKMIVYDDLHSIEPIKIYDYGVNHRKRNDNSFLVEYRAGNVMSPHVSRVEALRNVCEDFISSISGAKRPISDGAFGLRVVRILEASELSLRKNGNFVKFKTNGSGVKQLGAYFS